MVVLPARSDGCPWVVGHRANTRRWIRKHLRSGADGVEVDLYLDESGRLVISHPPSRRRYPLLRERLASILSGVHLTPGVSPGELAALLPRGAILWLDLKARGTARILSTLPREVREWRPLVVSTRFHDEAREALREAPGALVVLSLQSRPPSPALLAKQAGASGFTIESTYIDEGLVEEARREGLIVAAWVVNDEHEAARLARLGVDIIITDFPGMVKRVCRSALQG